MLAVTLMTDLSFCSLNKKKTLDEGRFDKETLALYQLTCFQSRKKRCKEFHVRRHGELIIL